MNTHHNFLSFIFLFSLVTTCGAQSDVAVADWYWQYQRQQLPVGSVSKRVFSGAVAALMGCWATQASLHQPVIDDKQGSEFFEKVVNMRAEPVQWWQHMSPVVRGVLVGVFFYAIASSVYKHAQQRVRALLPEGTQNQTLRAFLQQWPRYKEKIEPLFHPLFDRMHDYVDEYGSTDLPHLDDICDGVALLARLHEKKDINAYIEACRSKKESYIKWLPSKNASKVMYAATAVADFLVPLIISIMLGQRMYLGQSLRNPGLVLLAYVVVRGVASFCIDNRIQAKMNHHIKNLVSREQEGAPTLQEHTLAPLQELCQQTGKMPTLTDRQVRTVAAVLAASQRRVPEGTAFLTQLLGPRQTTHISRFIRSMTTSNAAIAVMPALAGGVLFRGSTRATAVSYGTSFMLLALLGWWQKGVRETQQRAERFAHFIQNWPRYQHRLPKIANDLIGPMHASGDIQLTPRGMDQLYEKLMVLCAE